MDGQKTPIAKGVNARATRTARANDFTLPKAYPCSISEVGQNGQTLTLKFETDPGGFTLPMPVAPVWNPRYVRYPWKKGEDGDKGVMLMMDAFHGNVTGLGDQKTGAPFVNPGNLTGGIWVPLGNTEHEPPDNPNAVQHNAPEGHIARDDAKKAQVITHPDNGSAIQHGGDGQGNYKHSVTSKDGVQVATDQATTIQSTNATLNSAGDLTNTGTHHASKDITSDTKVMAPNGTFGSGSMGGLSMLSGILTSASGGGGGSSGTPLQINTTTSTVQADTVQAGSRITAPLLRTTGYTVAQLLALTVGAGDAGCRAHVTDFNDPTPTFFVQITSTKGGSTTVVPAFWTGTKWVVA